MSEEAYEAAKRSIHRALLGQTKFLQLRGLATLPPEIGQLAELEELYGAAAGGPDAGDVGTAQLILSNSAASLRKKRRLIGS